MTAKTPGAALAARQAGDDKTNDKLDLVRMAVRRQRDLQLQIAALEERTATAKRQLNDIASRELPDLFSEAGVTYIGLAAEGNLPAYDARLQPYFKAVLPKGSANGLEWLTANGHGDLVKTVFTIPIGRGQSQLALAVREFLRRSKIEFSERSDVPWQTLTAFVRTEIENGRPIPLTDLGATVGQVVKLIEKKE